MRGNPGVAAVRNTPAASHKWELMQWGSTAASLMVTGKTQCSYRAVGSDSEPIPWSLCACGEQSDGGR